MNFTAAIANSLWFASNLPAATQFRRALNRPAETQTQLLRNYLKRNANTAFGNAHGFSEIKNYNDFARRVPLSDYDDLKLWIEKIKHGEKSVLTSEPVTHLVPTSGSSGARKLIPFTNRLQHEFNRAVSAWTANLYRCFPSVALGSAYWSISPAIEIEESETSAVPIGFDDDSAYLGGARKRLVDAVMVVPSELRLISDTEQFRYLTLLCLLRREDLRLISIWHPSFLSLLLDTLPAFWKDLLHDIESGNCRYAKLLSPPILRALKLRALPNRASGLRNADPAKPESIWPHLKIISCWGDGHAKLSRDEIQRRFPSVFIQSKGLLATECVVTIPAFDSYPLAITSHFFEFVDELGQIFLAHELKKNKIYEVVVTTGGGLWRYRMHDQVKVIRFAGRTPSLNFVGRKGIVSDRFGEKLSETFVAQSIREAISDLSLTPNFALLAPDENGAEKFYTLYAEGEVQPELALRLDVLLAKNPHYAWCRKIGQLQPLRLFRIKSGGHKTFIDCEISRKKRLGEIKPLALSLQSGWTQAFDGNYLASKIVLRAKSAGIRSCSSREFLI
jgi:GH3 auxin-responsive promoter